MADSIQNSPIPELSAEIMGERKNELLNIVQSLSEVGEIIGENQYYRLVRTKATCADSNREYLVLRSKDYKSAPLFGIFEVEKGIPIDRMELVIQDLVRKRTSSRKYSVKGVLCNELDPLANGWMSVYNFHETTSLSLEIALNDNKGTLLDAGHIITNGSSASLDLLRQIQEMKGFTIEMLMTALGWKEEDFKAN